jgi:hypothetical protein
MTSLLKSSLDGLSGSSGETVAEGARRATSGGMHFCSCWFCGKGAWAKSNRPAMTRAYPPSWFTGRMASLTDLWNENNQPQVSSQLSLAF